MIKPQIENGKTFTLVTINLKAQMKWFGCKWCHFWCWPRPRSPPSSFLPPMATVSPGQSTQSNDLKRKLHRQIGREVKTYQTSAVVRHLVFSSLSPGGSEGSHSHWTVRVPMARKEASCKLESVGGISLFPSFCFVFLSASSQGWWPQQRFRHLKSWEKMACSKKNREKGLLWSNEWWGEG